MTKTVEVITKDLDSDPVEYEVTFPGGESVEGTEVNLPTDRMISQNIVDGMVVVDFPQDTVIDYEFEEGHRYEIITIKVEWEVSNQQLY